MVKLKKLLAVLLVITFSIAGCGTEKESTTEGKEKTKGIKESQNTISEKNKETGSVTDLGKVVVYSPQGDEKRGTWIMKKAKEETGLDVQFLCAGGGELSDRLVAEKNNPQADVVMGLAQNAMYKLKEEGILAAYEAGWSAELPEVYREKENYFNSFWQTPIVIAYNTDFISEDEAPKSWEDLIKSEYKGKYGIGNTGSQTTRTYLIGLLWNYYDEAAGEISQEGWDFLSQIYENAGTMPSNDPDIWKAFKDGEMPILLWWYGGVVSNCKENNIPVAYVKPENGTPVVAEAIGLVSGAQNKEAAEKFIDWFGSAEVMSDYAKEFGQAPALPAAIELCPEDVKESATMFTAQNIDWEVASNNLDTWLEKIELEIMP